MRHGGGVLNQSINAVDHYSTTEIKFSTLGSTVLARREKWRELTATKFIRANCDKDCKEVGHKSNLP